MAKAEAVGERAVRFDLSGSDDRELPLILGLMPVLAKHAIKPEAFEETSFQAATIDQAHLHDRSTRDVRVRGGPA